jgi:hypothetical protein
MWEIAVAVIALLVMLALLVYVGRAVAVVAERAERTSLRRFGVTWRRSRAARS